MIKTFCDNCNSEIDNNTKMTYLKIANEGICNGTFYKGNLCNKCEKKLRKIIKVLSNRYGLGE